MHPLHLRACSVLGLGLQMDTMSAVEIIKKIKAMTPAEQNEVTEFIRQLRSAPLAVPATSQSVRFASLAEVEVAGEKVMQQYDEVFRRLAQ